MAKGISLSIASDTRDFASGVARGVVEPLEDVSDVLQEVVKDGDKAGRELEDAMSDARQDTAKLASEYEDLNRKIREAGKGSRRLGDDVEDGTTRAKEDLGELKDEAIQNASETFSSFDGSIDSLVDGIQGTLGGVVSNIGPLGAAAGAAAAIGVGLITAELQKSAERAAEIREETSALAQELIDAGGQLDAEAIAAKVHEWSLEVQDNKEWWELWQESAVTNLDKVNDIAGKTGVNMRDLFDAMSGQDSTKALDMLDDMQGRADELDRQLAQLSQARAGGTKRAQELRTERDALNDGTKAIRERLDIQEGAEDDYRQLTALTAELTAEAEAATAAEEAHTDAVGALQRGLDSAVGSWTDYIDKETQAADPEAYLKGMRERMEATVSFNDNVQQLADDFGLTQDEVQAILDQGIDFAPMLQAIIDGGPKMQEKYAEQMRAMLDGGEAILDGQEISATVTTKADTKDAARDLDKTATQKRTARIGTKADTKDAGREIDTVAEKDRTATVKVELDWTDADREMQAFLTKTRNVTVDVQTRAGKRTP